MKDTMELHYGKCRIKDVWHLTHTSDEKSDYLTLHCVDIDHSFLTFLWGGVP